MSERSKKTDKEGPSTKVMLTWGFFRSSLEAKESCSFAVPLSNKLQAWLEIQRIGMVKGSRSPGERKQASLEEVHCVLSCLVQETADVSRRCQARFLYHFRCLDTLRRHRAELKMDLSLSLWLFSFHLGWREPKKRITAQQGNISAAHVIHRDAHIRAWEEMAAEWEQS